MSAALTDVERAMLRDLRAGLGPMCGATTYARRGGRKRTLAALFRLALVGPAPRSDANPWGVRLTASGYAALQAEGEGAS